MTKNSVLNFNWTVLNVSVNHYIPNCEVIRHPVQSLNNNDHKYKKHLYFNINSKHNIISISGGFEIEILKALEAKYHFTSHYIDGRQMWGVRQQNGSWDGMVKQIQDNDCQVALCSTSRTLERMAVVDYSETTHLDEITFVSLWPDRLSKDLTLALPLERAVWVLTFIAFIVISLLLYFFTSKGKRKPSFSLILLHLLAIYLNKSVELWRGRTLLKGTKDESGSRILFTRMLYCFWAVGSMVLSIGYGCKLYSTLTSPSHAQPLDSVGELLAAVTSDSHNVFVKRNTALWSLIFAASEKNFLYYSLAKHIIRNPVSKTTTADIKLIKTVREGHNNVAIANRLNIFIMVQKFQTLDKKFHISTETLALDSIGFMLAKKSPLLPFFNKQIIVFKEMGLVGRWFNDALKRTLPKTEQFKFDVTNYRGNKSKNRSNFSNTETHVSTFKIVDMFTIFKLWFFGNIFATFTFVIEFLLFYLYKNSCN